MSIQLSCHLEWVRGFPVCGRPWSAGAGCVDMSRCAWVGVWFSAVLDPWLSLRLSSTLTVFFFPVVLVVLVVTTQRTQLRCVLRAVFLMTVNVLGIWLGIRASGIRLVVRLGITALYFEEVLCCRDSVVTCGG